MSRLLKKIRATKRDYSEYLFHFTRARNKYENDPDSPIDQRLVASYTAFEVLKQILSSGKLKGTFAYAPEKCICFSETPIDELIWLMSQEEWEHDVRYSFYGIAVKKAWLYSKGGRPVIYQHANEKDTLGSSHLYRHNRYEPESDVDWSWEREWRVKANYLDLDPAQALVICLSAAESKEIMLQRFCGNEWLSTSIELLRR